MAVIDLDGIFERFLRDIMKKEAGTRTEAEWEDRMAELYAQFGGAPLKELGGKSPEAYFADMSGEQLISALREYVAGELSVPDFLCDAVVNSPETEGALVRLVDDEDEELASYAVNMLSDKSSKLPFDKYLDMIVSDGTCEEMKDLVAESLADSAAEVKEKILARYGGASEEAKGYFLELLVAAGQDDRTFELLKKAFGAGEENIPLFAAYFAKLGDDRALPLLYRVISRSDIDYRDFSELKFAIEALGGEYEEKRDFSRDSVYKKVLAQRKKEGR